MFIAGTASIDNEGAIPPSTVRPRGRIMIKRNIWLLVVSLFIGPAIGAVTFLTLVNIIDGGSASSNASAQAFTDDYWPLVLMFAYVVGWLPAGISAIIMMLVTRFLPTRWLRLITGTVIGAIVSAAYIGLFIFADHTNSMDDFAILGIAALTGGVSALFCIALIELFHPLPKPPVPAS